MNFMDWKQIHELSPDLNLTPLAAFLRFCRVQRGAALGKNIKKQQEVSDLNQDYHELCLNNAWGGLGVHVLYAISVSSVL